MSVGTYRVTADGYAGPSGVAVRVHEILVKSDGTAAVVQVKNGSAGSEVDSITGVADQGFVRPYEGGIVMDGGCYINLDAHTTYVVVSLEVIG